MADEEEVGIEVEAVEAVYGEDCVVIKRFPPHLYVHIKPRTADDSSQQFVEAVLEFRASPQYPDESPHISVIESKGLDEMRQASFVTGIKEKANELSSCLMLVALCEEAVEMLCNINHPDGDCPLCLYPLVEGDGQGDFIPFMKLMSCFHCFHRKCIIRWWNWLQEQGETNPSMSFNATVTHTSDLPGPSKKYLGNCPVCRKVFHTSDVEHVLNLAETHTSQLSPEETEADDDKELLQSAAEKLRRLNFEALLKLQEDNKGLIQPKRNEVVQPGMFLPEPVTPPTVTTKDSAEPQQTQPTSIPTLETGTSRSHNRANTSGRKNFGGMRRNKNRTPRTQNQQWVERR